MIQVLQKAAAILQTIQNRKDAASFTEIVTATGIHKATLSHILKTLVGIGFLEKTTNGRYAIGPQILALAEHRRRRGTLAALAEEHARALAEAIRETVTVGTLRKGERFNLAKATVEQSVSVNAELQQRPSPYETTTGRVLLAYADPKERAAIVESKGLPGDRWPEVQTRKELDRAFARIREQGMASARAADGQADTCAIPIRGPDGRVWAAIGFGAPAFRMEGEARARKVEALGWTAARMEELLALQETFQVQEIDA